MKKLLVSLLLVTPMMAFAGPKKAAKEGFKLIHVAELQKWMDKDAAAVHVFDANTDEVRKSDGLIPGAVALASSSSYETTVLPENKAEKVVFYCANTACMASHTAAKRAAEAGYTEVYVMADGIQGWKKAGKKTVPQS